MAYLSAHCGCQAKVMLVGLVLVFKLCVRGISRCITIWGRAYRISIVMVILWCTYNKIKARNTIADNFRWSLIYLFNSFIIHWKQLAAQISWFSSFVTYKETKAVVYVHLFWNMNGLGSSMLKWVLPLLVCPSWKWNKRERVREREKTLTWNPSTSDSRK